MKFLGKEIGNFKEPFIVAEISGNHAGGINNAYRLIDEAKKAGADAVKIQCYDKDSLTIPNGYVINSKTPWDGETLYELYMKSSTPFEWVPLLFEHAKKIDIPIFSSVYCKKGLEELQRVNCPAYKIASFEANNPYFIGMVSRTNKPVIVSTGMLSFDEVDRAYEASGDNSILLHCVSKYPLKVSDLNLTRMRDFINWYDSPIGFSCHSNDTIAPIIAVASGAAMIELHLQLEDVEGEDKEFSFYPGELSYITRMCKSAYEAFRLKTDIDSQNRSLRRSLYVVQDIKEGELFTEENIKSFRPALGCEPYLLPTILGHKAKRDLTKYTPMQMEYVKP